MRRFQKFAMTFCGAALIAVSALAVESTNTFTVAAYNVENWVLMERNGKPDQPKPRSEKEAVFKVLAQVHADVLGIEEMGGKDQLAELADGLRQRGLDYPHREWIQGGDPTRHVALLSRYPIAKQYSRVDYTYQLAGNARRIERGILDVEVKVTDHYSFRAVAAHLKSKRQSNAGDQTVMRLEEARLLRSHIGKTLKDNPRLNLVAMGDFNDTPESEPIRTIIGEPPFALFALRPLDSGGGDGTHYWRSRDQFSRIDYLVLSPGMTNEYVEGSAHIADVPEWKDASDHRAVYARFSAHDIGERLAGEESQAPSGSLPPSSVYAIPVAVVAGVVLIATITLYRQRPAEKE